VRVSELGVADVGETVVLLVVPAMSQLRQPRERLRVLDLLRDQLADDVAVVHLDRADGHNLLSVAGRQLADQQHDHRVQLRYLYDHQQRSNTTNSDRPVASLLITGGRYPQILDLFQDFKIGVPSRCLGETSIFIARQYALYKTRYINSLLLLLLLI